MSLRLSPQLCLNFLLVESTHSPFEPYARCTAHGPSFVRLLEYSKASMSDPNLLVKWKLPLIFDNKAFSTRSGRAERFHYSMRTVYFNSPRLVYGDFDTRACSGYQALFPLPRDSGDEVNATPPPLPKNIKVGNLLNIFSLQLSTSQSHIQNTEQLNSQHLGITLCCITT